MVDSGRRGRGQRAGGEVLGAQHGLADAPQPVVGCWSLRQPAEQRAELRRARARALEHRAVREVGEVRPVVDLERIQS